MTIVLIIFAVLLSAAAAVLLKSGLIQFFLKGMEHNFTFKELCIFRKAAVNADFENIVSPFYSEKKLDKCIKNIIASSKSSGIQLPYELMLKFFALRKSIELDELQYSGAITTTRKISAGQKINICINGTDIYQSVVLENTKKSLAVAYPDGMKLPVGLYWRGHKINIYFRRNYDAGYVFESTVLSDIKFGKVPMLYVCHSDRLVRSQKRNSFRTTVNKGGEIYVFPNPTYIKCKVLNISEGGAAVLVKGRGRAGIKVGVKIDLAGMTGIVEFTGVVCTVNYSQKLNQSTLHVKMEPPPSDELRIRILCYVYSIW